MSVIDQMLLGNWPVADDPAYSSSPQIASELSGSSIGIPGFPPFVTDAQDALDALYNLAIIIEALSAEVSFIPILNVVAFLIDIVLLLLPQFMGRPRQEATLNCANNLLKAKNSAAILAGQQILRIFQQWDIVISESGPGEVIVASIVSQMVNNLTGQGITLQHARSIVLYQFQQGADNLGVIHPRLNQPVAPGTQIFGPQGFQRIFQDLVDKLVAQGQTQAKAEEHALIDLLKYVPLKWINHIYIGHQPNNPPPGGCPPDHHWDKTANNGQGGCVPDICKKNHHWDPTANNGDGGCVPDNCPPGYHWDHTINFGAGGCTPDFPKPPGPPPPWTPPPGTPPLGQPDPEGDEITNELCKQMQDNTLATLYMLDRLTNAVSGSTDPNCCANIVAAITPIATAINALIAALPAPAGAPVINFAPVITVDVPPGPPPTVTINESPSDLSGVVEQLKRRNDDLQVPEDWKTQLIQSGAVPLDLVPLLQSTTWETVEAAVANALGYMMGVGFENYLDAVERIFKVVIKPVAGVIWKILTDFIAGFDLGSGDAMTQVANAAKAVVKALDGAVIATFGTAANLVIDGYESGISGIDTTTEAGISQVTQILMGRALELGMSAHVIANLCEMTYFTKQLGFNSTAALLAELAGFHEVIIQSHRPFMTAALGRPATQSFNRKYPSTLPGIGPAMTLFARRKMLQSDAQHLADSAGYNRSWQTALFAGAYRPLSARALATLVQDTPFNRAQMQEILEDNAFSPDHVQTMLDLLEYNSTKNLRNSYISQAETAYKQGVISDDEMHQIVIDAGWSDQAWQLVNSKILIERRMTLASEVEKQVIPLVANGNITADAGLQQLEAAGVQDWYAQLVITLATTKAEIHAAKLEAAAEAKLKRQRQVNLTRAATSEYQRGAIDLPALGAALLAIGLDPTLAASITAVQDATRAGKLRFVFGQFLTPEDAKVLEERVAAIEGQFKKQLLTRDQTAQQLSSLNIPPDQVAALLARWAAALAATGKYAYLLSPLTGQPPTP
jgi:hypothetical protein